MRVLCLMARLADQLNIFRQFVSESHIGQMVKVERQPFSVRSTALTYWPAFADNRRPEQPPFLGMNVCDVAFCESA